MANTIVDNNKPRPAPQTAPARPFVPSEPEPRQDAPTMGQNAPLPQTAQPSSPPSQTPDPPAQEQMQTSPQGQVPEGEQQVKAQDGGGDKWVGARVLDEAEAFLDAYPIFDLFTAVMNTDGYKERSALRAQRRESLQQRLDLLKVEGENRLLEAQHKNRVLRSRETLSPIIDQTKYANAEYERKAAEWRNKHADEFLDAELNKVRREQTNNDFRQQQDAFYTGAAVKAQRVIDDIIKSNFNGSLSNESYKELLQSREGADYVTLQYIVDMLPSAMKLMEENAEYNPYVNEIMRIARGNGIDVQWDEGRGNYFMVMPDGKGGALEAELTTDTLYKLLEQDKRKLSDLAIRKAQSDPVTSQGEVGSQSTAWMTRQFIDGPSPDNSSLLPGQTPALPEQSAWKREYPYLNADIAVQALKEIREKSSIPYSERLALDVSQALQEVGARTGVDWNSPYAEIISNPAISDYDKAMFQQMQSRLASVGVRVDVDQSTGRVRVIDPNNMVGLGNRRDAGIQDLIDAGRNGRAGNALRDSLRTINADLEHKAAVAMAAEFRRVAKNYNDEASGASQGGQEATSGFDMNDPESVRNLSQHTNIPEGMIATKMSESEFAQLSSFAQKPFDDFTRKYGIDRGLTGYLTPDMITTPEYLEGILEGAREEAKLANGFKNKDIRNNLLGDFTTGRSAWVKWVSDDSDGESLLHELRLSKAKDNGFSEREDKIEARIAEADKKVNKARAKLEQTLSSSGWKPNRSPTGFSVPPKAVIEAQSSLVPLQRDLQKAKDEMKKFREYLDAPPTDEEILEIAGKEYGEERVYGKRKRKNSGR